MKALKKHSVRILNKANELKLKPSMTISFTCKHKNVPFETISDVKIFDMNVEISS